MPIFLGYSPSGVVEGDVVYANFGTEKDFRKLNEMGVSVKNKIVLVRQGRVFRGNKVLQYNDFNDFAVPVFIPNFFNYLLLGARLYHCIIPT